VHGVNGSASVKGGQLTLTVTNPSLDQLQEIDIAVRGGNVGSIRITTLASADVHAHNSFEYPRAVEPKEQVSASSRSPFRHRLSPASITKFEITLA